jgi:hypothetical protein
VLVSSRITFSDYANIGSVAVGVDLAGSKLREHHRQGNTINSSVDAGGSFQCNLQLHVIINFSL